MAATGNTQTEGQVEASAGNTSRVWVGNLAYKSSEQDLRDAFAGMKMYVFFPMLLPNPSVFLLLIHGSHADFAIVVPTLACLNGLDDDKGTPSSPLKMPQMLRRPLPR